MSFPRRGLPIFRFLHHVEIVLLSLLSGARISTELVQIRWLLASILPCALDCGTLRDLLAPARRKKSGMCWQQLRNIYQTHDLHEVILTLEMYSRWMDLSTVVVAVTKRAKSALFSLSRAQIAISRKSANRSFPLFFNFFIWREQTRVFKSVKEDYTGLMGTV